MGLYLFYRKNVIAQFEQKKRENKNDRLPCIITENEDLPLWRAPPTTKLTATHVLMCVY